MLLRREISHLSFFLANCLALCSFVSADQYEKWLEEEVPYIIAEKERKEFKALSSASERDLFIQRFWQLRDLDPSTEENEFKREHERRIRYANENFTTAGQAGRRIGDESTSFMAHLTKCPSFLGEIGSALTSVARQWF